MMDKHGTYRVWHLTFPTGIKMNKHSISNPVFMGSIFSITHHVTKGFIFCWGRLLCDFKERCWKWLGCRVPQLWLLYPLVIKHGNRTCPIYNWCSHYEQFDFRGHCEKNMFDYHSVFMLSTFCTLRKGMWICWRSGPDGPDGPDGWGSSHATHWWDLVGCHDVMMSWQDEQWFNDTIMDFFLCLGLIWCWFFCWGSGQAWAKRPKKRGRDQVSDFLCAVFQQICLVNVGYFGFWDLDGFRAPIHHRSIVFHFRPARGQREGEHRKPRRLAIEVAAPAKLQEEVYVTWCCRPSSFFAPKSGKWWEDDGIFMYFCGILSLWNMALGWTYGIFHWPGFHRERVG